MEKLTWSHPCLYCNRPILRGLPALIFSREQTQLLGLSHSTCSATKYRYARYQIHPPQQMTAEQVAFLMNFYSRLNALPGSYLPNGELRFMLCQLIDEYPDSLIDAMDHFRDRRIEYARLYHGVKYEGDLETDYLKFLGDTQLLAKKTEAPEVDFKG
jgi:hypothetical protein